MDSNQVVQNSETVAPSGASSNTVAGGGSAGSSTAASTMIPSAVAVVAPKGFRQELQQMLLGWQAVIPSDSTVTSSAGSLTAAGVLAQLQAYLGPYLDLDTHATATKTARAQAKSQLTEARQYHAVLKSAVTNLLGKESPELAQFGLSPRKPRKALTASQLAVRAAKSQATRRLRGTMSAKQKAPIKSGPMQFVRPVPGVPDGAVANPLAPVASSAPAVSTTPVTNASPVAGTAPVDASASAVSSPAAGK